MKLRSKILSGFLILSFMLLLAGIWSVHQLRALGASAQRMLDENYKSINAAEAMIEALERQDSAILLLILGRWEEGRSIIEAADRAFEQGLEIAEGNITLPDEQGYIEATRSNYLSYKNIWMRPIVGTVKERNLAWYTDEVHPAFLVVKSSVNKLLEINDVAMYEMSSDLKDKASRAVMPGVVAVISALAFSLLFSYFVNYYMVGPIIRITRGVHDFLKTGKPFDVKVESRDEIARLVTAIHELCSAAQVSGSK